MFEINISGMTCGGCVKSVTNALLKLDPKAQIDISLEKQLVKIESEKALPTILETIEKSGFDVVSAK